MSGIRPLERTDLQQVASLYEFVVRSGSRKPPAGLARHFERTFLEHPWVDPSIPSLVYEDESGAVRGFIGSHVRRFRFDGEEIRIAYPGQLVADHESRGRAPGFFLLRAYLGGSQSATVTDTAGPPTRRIWNALGGRQAQINSVEWFRFFRPWQVLAERLGARRRSPAERLSSLLDSLTTRLPTRLRPPPPPTAPLERLGAPELVGAMAALGPAWRAYPDYDLAYCDWLLAELNRVRAHGTLVCRLVRDGKGDVGWYIYYARAGRVGHVLQLVARPGHTGAVVDALFHDAFRRGLTGLRGRMEQRLLETLSSRRVFLRRSTMGDTLIHARKPELERVLLSGEAPLSRLDGEWWAGFHLEAFSRREDG